MVTKELASVYICSDGKRFLDKKKAEKYEEGINSIIDHYNILGDLEIIGWQFCTVPGAYDRD